MKRIIITIALFIAGMAFIAPFTGAQDMSSFYTNQFMSAEGSFTDRLVVLEAMQADGITGSPEFYHEALRFHLARVPDMNWNNRAEKIAAEQAVVILAQALGAAKYTAAASELWRAAEYFDVVREQPYTPNEGHAQQAALIALGNIDGRHYIPHIVQRLTNYNTQTYKQTETKRRVQTAVIGCIRALETFKDISGYRPVFFVYVGAYDGAVKQIASSALPNITDDPCDVVIEIIRDPSVTPPVKLEAWNEMARTRAPNTSRAKVAAVALDVGWTYQTGNRAWQNNLRQLRKNAIEIIRQHGIQGDNVYVNLEKSYSNNFISTAPDNDEIVAALNALSALKTDEAVNLLYKFLNELHTRRRRGPWRQKEQQHFTWVVDSIGFTGTNSAEVKLLLRSIQMSPDYTAQEKNRAGNALSSLGN